MKLSWRLVAAGLVVAWVVGVTTSVRPAAQAVIPSPPAGAKAGTFFKNVTSSTLKDLSVDDFISAMGVMSAALGFDCADCHPGAGSDTVNWSIDTYPTKRTARRMLEMLATINKTQFGGVQKVTCWTCHHGRDIPASSIMLDRLYEEPNNELDDVVTADRDQPSADQVFDKYIAALGGAQKLASLKSYIISGVSIGYAGLGGNGEFMVYAKAPDKRTQVITFQKYPDRGDSLWTVNGNVGWVKTPRALLRDYQLTGEELDGQRFDARMAFPGGIKTALTNWRVGSRRTIKDKDYTVVQGSGENGFLATLYFDLQTNLLARVVRYGRSPVGHVLVQTDFSDYKDVDGIKFPFTYQFTWLDGRFQAKITDVKVNVPIDDSKFGKPF